MRINNDPCHSAAFPYKFSADCTFVFSAKITLCAIHQCSTFFAGAAPPYLVK